MTAIPRVIPVLLINDGYLVKPVKFGKEKYIGDPVNAVKIFNEKQVDEVFICDIGASRRGGVINLPLLEEIASEAFMPMGYGGGVMNLADAERVISAGFEKIVINSGLRVPGLVNAVSDSLGSASTVVSVDVRRKLTGYETYAARGTRPLKMSPVALATKAVSEGAGEILLSSIDREGSFSGYDTDLIRSVSTCVNVPVVALGGARGLEDFTAALNAGASAVAAGSAFVLNGRHRAVLITYPSPRDISALTATQAGEH